MNLATPKVGAKHELLFNEPESGLDYFCTASQLFLKSVFQVNLQR
jgi:hypothetical protein